MHFNNRFYKLLDTELSIRYVVVRCVLLCSTRLPVHSTKNLCYILESKHWKKMQDTSDPQTLSNGHFGPSIRSRINTIC